CFYRISVARISQEFRASIPHAAGVDTSVDEFTDRGAGDLHAAPNYLPSKLARACGYSAARGFLEGMA
ncbi:hypothetical protein Q5L94_14120, partial [Idiomarina sp. Sol25]|uniref:hypothetical protein n=1 Tax=Idiomarina sp. Sol25 TaxID=3064000 RepID=UPI00294AD602